MVTKGHKGEDKDKIKENKKPNFLLLTRSKVYEFLLHAVYLLPIEKKIEFFSRSAESLVAEFINYIDKKTCPKWAKHKTGK